ncbi:MAG TPA: CocE/NonD family hydrolase [Pyrinomonadaceae bacterium]|nr:CocE/NonD family hydrolase [Pyrinomonadaceae bacterium]
MLKRIALVSFLLLSLVSSPTSSQTTNTSSDVNLLLSRLPANVETKRYKGYVQPRSNATTSKSFYLPMRDGVKIAVTLVLPEGLQANEKIPSLMTMTRYWRGKQSEQANPFFPSHGYAHVLVDARGTGASYGIWKAPFSQDEIKDYNEVVNWIISQPWSNGKVGATGNSYTGNTALWLATSMNPAVKVVVPRHYEFDLFAETPYPGGLLTDWVIKSWNEGNRQLDTNAGVKLVDDDTDQKLYKEATARRSENMNVYAAALSTSSRDDRTFGSSLDELSLHSYASQIEKSGVAINSWGGWFDASTADAVIKTFMTLNNYQRGVIGPWNHGGGQNASPYKPAQPERVMWGFETLRFFDHYLKGIDTGLDKEKLLYYFTIGEEKWKVTSTWPVPNTKMTRWYFNANNSLGESPPEADSGEDRYTVNFEATTGEKNRWHTQVGGEVVYPDRANEDKKLLTYTSAALESDLEITGYPVVTLYLSSTHTDGGFYVYLEEVDETGKVTYLTEGALRGIHRRISTEQSPLKIFVPYHSFKRKDAAPLVPGEVTEIKFGLQPISALIKKGHRLRVAIAGHDRDTFIRIPAEGTPTIAVQRNKRALSSIELPIVKR